MAARVYEAKVALLALLEGVAFPGSPQPEIKYGPPTEGEDAPFGGEMVFLGESRAVTAPQMGSRRDESFNLRVVVDVRHEGDDEQSVEARAWQLADAVEAAVWADHPAPLDGTVNRVSRIEKVQVNAPEPQVWHTQIVCDLAVEAPLT